MAETYTLASARILDENMLMLVFTAGAARSGTPVNDPTKFSISSSGTTIGVKVPDVRWAYRGVLGADASHHKPVYTPIDGSTATATLVQYVELDRVVQQSEDGDITVTLTAGYIADDTNTSAAATSVNVDVLTFCDANGRVSPDGFPLRAGSSETPVAVASAGTRLLHIKASDTAGVGDGGTVTSFTATVGGTISPNGSPVYNADQSVAGSTAGIDVITLTGTNRLDTTTSLNSGGSTAASFTVFFVGWFDTASTGASVIYLQTRTPDIETPVSIFSNAGTYKVGIRDWGDITFNARNDYKRLTILAYSYDFATGTRTLYDPLGNVVGTSTNAEAGKDWSGDLWVRNVGSDTNLAELIVYDDAISQSNIKGVLATLMLDYSETAIKMYVDPDAGSDTNDGLTSSTPWKTFPLDDTRAFRFGSGDRVLFKAGESVAANTRIIIEDQWLVGVGAGRKYPALISYYGDRADGRVVFPVTSNAFTAGHEIQYSSGVAVVGLHFDNQFRNPRHANYGGFSATNYDAGMEFTAFTLRPTLAANRFNNDDGNLTIFCDNEIGYFGTGYVDDVAPDIERILLLQNNYFHDCYSATSSSNRDHLALGGFLSGHTVFFVDKNLNYRCGWNPDVASVGDWSAGAKTWETGVTATYSSGTDTTSLTKTGAFSNVEWFDTPGTNTFIAGPLYITVKGADTTEYETIIDDKVSDNELIVVGNPLGLADAGTESVELHGGTPGAENGLVRAQYYSTEASPASVNRRNINIDGSDLDQQRGGGYKHENIASDNSGAGFVQSTTGICSLVGNFAEGGKRNRGLWWPNVRSWGWALGGYDTSDPYYAEAFENICNMDYDNRAETDYPTADGSTRALTLTWNTTAGEAFIANNTILRGAGDLLKFAGVSNTANTTVTRNVVVQGEAGADAVTDTDLVAGSYGSAVFSNNVFNHPDGSGADHFNGNTETFAEWEATVTSSGQQFADPGFNNSTLRLLPEYYAHVSGSAASQDAFIAAVQAEYASGVLSDYTTDAILPWILEQTATTNIGTSDGGGIYKPGASAFIPVPTGPLPKSRGFWGLKASRMDIPKFIQKNFQDSAVLTRRGWEQRLPGSNPDKGMTEVVVAGNFGIPAGDNEAPYFFEGVNSLSRTLEGTSGSPINPYIIEIVDPDKVLEGDAVSVASSSGLPSGLSVQKMSINSPLEIFAIVGTPSGSGTGTIEIVFEDGSSSQITATISYNITA